MSRRSGQKRMRSRCLGALELVSLDMSRLVRFCVAFSCECTVTKVGQHGGTYGNYDAHAVNIRSLQCKHGRNTMKLSGINVTYQFKLVGLRNGRTVDALFFLFHDI
eukprot:110373-Pyramimonas_sp.AAC.1